MYKAIKNIRASLRFIPQTLSKQPIFPLSTSLISSSPSSLSHTRQRHDDSNAEESNKDSISPPTLFVVQPRFRPETLLKTKLNEALNLANSLEEQRDGYYDTEFSKKDLPPHIVVQNPAYRSTRADTFFGPGTVDTVKCHINAVDSQDGVDAVFVNAILTGIQQRNLERAWGKPVLDRVGLIIEIFHAHAETKEAKLQAELAALMYKRTRLVRIRGSDGRYTFGAAGEAEVVSARGRGGSGGRGFISGAGETELQLQRRRILERRSQLLLEIKEVRRTRALQRASRKRHGGSHGQDMPTVAIVGYTNAGKSTLVSALSDTYLFCDDRLFATVDPKVRSVILPSGKKVLLSDTVGFISELPVQLVEAFHATLEEVVEADLLVHVLDSSAPNRDMQRESVLQVLQQIGVPEEKLQNMIEVWNKIDLTKEEVAANESDDGRSENMDDDVDDVMSLSGDSGETMDGDHGDCSDGWLSDVDGVEWDDVSGSFMGRKPSEDQPEEVSSKECGVITSESRSQPECSPHVKTSAITGVGLQELLQLIDDKLKTEKVVERGIFDRKWRPPREQDTGVVNG